MPLPKKILLIILPIFFIFQPSSWFILNSFCYFTDFLVSFHFQYRTVFECTDQNLKVVPKSNTNSFAHMKLVCLNYSSKNK